MTLIKTHLSVRDDYPLAPGKMKMCPKMLSPYCKPLSEDLKLGSVAVPKIVPTLSDKTK
jgi:hypothetical protein